MSQYSELIGSFIRTSNFPIEADYVFETKLDLLLYYSNPINAATMYEGMLRVAKDNGKLVLYWVVKNNNVLEFEPVTTSNTDSVNETDLENIKNEVINQVNSNIENKISDSEKKIEETIQTVSDDFTLRLGSIESDVNLLKAKEIEVETSITDTTKLSNKPISTKAIVDYVDLLISNIDIEPNIPLTPEIVITDSVEENNPNAVSSKGVYLYIKDNTTISISSNDHRLVTSSAVYSEVTSLSNEIANLRTVLNTTNSSLTSTTSLLDELKENVKEIDDNLITISNNILDGVIAGVDIKSLPTNNNVDSRIANFIDTLLYASDEGSISLSDKIDIAYSTAQLNTESLENVKSEIESIRIGTIKELTDKVNTIVVGTLTDINEYNKPEYEGKSVVMSAPSIINYTNNIVIPEAIFTFTTEELLAVEEPEGLVPSDYTPVPLTRELTSVLANAINSGRPVLALIDGYPLYLALFGTNHLRGMYPTNGSINECIILLLNDNKYTTRSNIITKTQLYIITKISQADYDALEEKDENSVYFII